ncbi:adenosylcobinamide-phosphate synthase CbiB [Tindallia californiensis]|uniref:Cobalamin biosynthesis protein CobD n=1 Tax=Tindallia californiensis TaxID=159292 RepID=A0A1H3I9B4_9FIRM|nr:adenosylcobinamide-phosphate synthase CbiB [Tindallia californiensis]SDY24270.1 adenosylcobinamide-phosphate synthase [Tindallia californiensis]
MIIISAFLLDLLLGDPEDWPHPVRCIGKLITFLEGKLRSEKQRNSKYEMVMGFLLTIIVVCVTIISAWSLQRLFSSIHVSLGFVFSVYLAYTTIAVKSLTTSAMNVYEKLCSQDIEGARYYLSMIVGRDTECLDESDITKAVIETVAENFSDGVVAPILYLFVGGPLLALTYKAINTMDSMIGYKNEKYIFFGRFAAKLDDAANWVPARLSVFFLLIAIKIRGLEWRKSIKIMLRDRMNHSSPNAGYPESMIAGALEIQLGGDSYYFGKKISKPTIGDNETYVFRDMICKTTDVMRIASIILAVFLGFLLIGIGGFRWSMVGMY